MNILSIKASDIDDWTSKEPRRAQDLLPKLIWKLILASSNAIEDHHFPFESAVQYAGYDGYLLTSDFNSFYPNGASVWEFGTDKNIKSKFNDDYKKRSDNSAEIEKSDTTFCFVTSRIWNHREGITEFTNSKKKDGIWKNVRILDANSLEMWFGLCPSVAAWFSKIIGKQFDGVMSLKDYWDYIIDDTEPKLNVEFFCHERESLFSDQIIKNLDEGCSQIILSAESKIEGVLTFIADLLNGTDFKKERLLSKTVVALSSSGLKNICENYKGAIIIPVYNNEINQAITDNTLIYPTEKDGPIDLAYKNSLRIIVKSRRRKVFSKALEKIGYDSNEANEIAGDVKCRFLPLFRKLTNKIQYKLPEWVSETNISTIIPALLANAWEGSQSGDKIAIEILSGQKYNEYISSISKYTHGDNMPIFNLEHSFACVSTNELWDILARNINDELFEKYKKCINYVFAEVDPMFDLTEDKWVYAGLYGKNSNFSERLKIGLILSMTKIVELSEETNYFDYKNECRKLVFNIYNGINNQNQWRTLVPYLPYFVEATPDSVIDVIENNVNKNSDIFFSLFKPSSDFLFGRNFYTNILSSLEKLIWIKEYSVRAINVLLRLDEKNFEYKLTNCPIDSLMKVFCLWCHQGALSTEEKDKLLAKIIVSNRVVARKLVSKLLPNDNSVITSLTEFRWRYIDDCNHEVTYTQLNNSIKSIATVFIQTLAPSYDDWKIIVNHFSVFYNVFIELKIDIKEKGMELSESERLKLCKEISYEISRKRKFPNKDDEVESNIITEMENLYNAFIPDSPLKYSHYYSYDFYGHNPIPFNSDEYDYEKENEATKRIRLLALEETLDSFNMDAIFTLAQDVKELKLLIDSFVDSKYFLYIDFDFISKAHLAFPKFADNLITSIFDKKGLSFFLNKLQGVTDDDIIWVVIRLPITPEVVEFIETFSEQVQSKFWQHADSWGIMHYDEKFARKCINSLLNYHRPYSAVRELFFSKFTDINLIIEVLQSALNYHPKTEFSGVNLYSIDNFCIERLFKKIYSEETIDIVKVSQLEFAYLNIFSSDFEPECIIKNALNSPDFFVELISYCYLKDNTVREDITEDNMRIAKLCSKVLDKIERLPGQTNNSVDIDKFNLWINSVIEWAKEANYTVACDIQIGRILSHSPMDEDGIWPHKCVREFLEKNTSETIVRQFHLGKYNQRGVYTVTGGDEEEKIADTYREYAQKLQILYPKTSQVLMQLSNHYKDEAKRERTRELKGYY